MGYNLYITRRHNWCDEIGPSISREEWIALVDADPELSLDRDADGMHANWSGECSYPDPWFAYDEHIGAIDTKNPDVPIIQKMLDIAAKLEARVQGDDGEIYTTPTNYYHQDLPNATIAQSPAGSWWRRLFGSA